jgi:hypothetical protein
MNVISLYNGGARQLGIARYSPRQNSSISVEFVVTSLYGMVRIASHSLDGYAARSVAF